MKSNNKARINAYISPKNYNTIDEVMVNHKLGVTTLSKGLILDLALTKFFKDLENGESLENMAVQFLKSIQ